MSWNCDTPRKCWNVFIITAEECCPWGPERWYNCPPHFFQPYETGKVELKKSGRARRLEREERERIARPEREKRERIRRAEEERTKARNLKWAQNLKSTRNLKRKRKPEKQ